MKRVALGAAAVVFVAAACGVSAQQRVQTAEQSLAAKPYLESVITLSAKGAKMTPIQAKILSRSYLTIAEQSTNGKSLATAGPTNINVDLKVFWDRQLLIEAKAIAHGNLYFKVDLAPLENSPTLTAAQKQQLIPLGAFAGKWIYIPQSALDRVSHQKSNSSQKAKVQALTIAISRAIVDSQITTGPASGQVTASGTSSSFFKKISPQLNALAGKPVRIPKTIDNWSISMTAPSGVMTAASVSISQRAKDVNVSATFTHNPVSIVKPSGAQSISALLGG